MDKPEQAPPSPVEPPIFTPVGFGYVDAEGRYIPPWATCSTVVGAVIIVIGAGLFLLLT